MQPQLKPILPIAPAIGEYQPSATFAAANPNKLPSLPSHLSQAGSKAYKEDSEYHKGQLEIYKLLNRNYRDEAANLNKVVILI